MRVRRRSGPSCGGRGAKRALGTKRTESGDDAVYLKPRSVLLEHDFGGLDDGFDFVADLELHGVDAAPGDDAFDHVVADPDGDVSHDLTEKDLLDLA